MKRFVSVVIAPVIILLNVVVARGDADTENFRGFYVFAHEARTFQPCGSESVYWVRAEEAISNRLRSEHRRLTAKPYEAIYVEVKGRLMPKAADGFAADYDGQIRIEAIVDIRSARKEDCRLAAAGGAAITDGVWKWQETDYKSQSKTFPDDPARYTVAFNDDGSLRIRADCNRAGGRYALQNTALTIEVTNSTRAKCPPESLEGRFLKDLNAAATHDIWSGDLYIHLKHDVGIMKFSK